MLHIHLSSGAVTRGPVVIDVPSGPSLNPPHELIKNNGQSIIAKINAIEITFSGYLVNVFTLFV
jgi:hypothetical protein